MKIWHHAAIILVLLPVDKGGAAFKSETFQVTGTIFNHQFVFVAEKIQFLILMYRQNKSASPAMPCPVGPCLITVCSRYWCK